MRKKDKLLHITNLNKKLNESKVSESFTSHMASYKEGFANSSNDGVASGHNVHDDGSNASDSKINDISEHHSGEYSDSIMNMSVSDFLDSIKNKDQAGYNVVEKVIEKNFKEGLEEGDAEDYYYPFDEPEREDDEFDPYKLKEMNIGLGDDLEYVDE